MSESLESVWAVVHPRPEGEVDNAPAPSGVEPGTLVIGVGERMIVRFKPNGELEFGEGYVPEEAARIFWHAVAAANPRTHPREDAEVQAITQRMLHALMVRLGEADLYCEQARLAAGSETAGERERFNADLATRNLEVHVHRVIEFARAIALAEREIKGLSGES